jgi:hypothetical protein
MITVDRVTPISLVEMFQVKFNLAQKWYYYLSNRTPDEVSVFVHFDSHPPGSGLNYLVSFLSNRTTLKCGHLLINSLVTPHMSFTDPNTRAFPHE